MKRKIAYAILGAFVIMQLLRPTRNISTEESKADIALHYEVPADLHAILKTSCYDCHSNHTNYPWYVNFQPLGWWLQSHVNQGKDELNFSEFGTYDQKRARHKFEEIEEMVKEGSMPLKPYLWMHKEAQLTPAQSDEVVAWAQSLK